MAPIFGSVHAYAYLHRYHAADVVVGESLGGICCTRTEQKKLTIIAQKLSWTKGKSLRHSLHGFSTNSFPIFLLIDQSSRVFGAFFIDRQK